MFSSLFKFHKVFLKGRIIKIEVCVTKSAKDKLVNWQKNIAKHLESFLMCVKNVLFHRKKTRQASILIKYLILTSKSLLL